jgi:uncharacterized lipoprotein YddW (UPF0748 family)
VKSVWRYILSLTVIFSACSKPAADEPAPQPDPEPEPQVETPEGKPRYVWIDASANFHYFANDKAYIAKELAMIADCGFTDIIVDVRPTEGTVLWKSKVAPEAKRLAAWLDSGYQFVYREATWDYLQAFIDAGHGAGLRVHAAINTFVCGYGGYYGLESEGPVFSGDIPEDWACMDWNGESIESSFYPGVQGTVFMNPASDDVQGYVLKLLDELAHYDIDGIVLDRCRYSDAGLKSEFSDASKAKFSAYIGKEPTVWPVMKTDSSTLPIAIADEQKAWLSFRAKTIHDFVEKAADTVHGVNPDMKFGVYVGAWYSTYYTSGVNWASPRYLTHTKYSRWADKDYHNYGFADHCDYMFLGCYASTSSIYGSGEWTMEGFAKQGASLLLGDTVFSGGPDVGNPEGWTSGRKSAYIPKTFDAIIKHADGYFVFDLCHIRMYEYWSAFKTTFNDYINSLTKY